MNNNTCLHVDCKTGNEGTKEIAEMLKENKSLTKLWLQHTHTHTKIKQHIKHILNNRKQN